MGTATSVEWAWNGYGMLGTLPALTGWVLAAFVYFAAPDPRRNLPLAMLLFIEGTAWLGANAFNYFATESNDALAWMSLNILAGIWFVPALLRFIGKAIDTPITRPLRNSFVVGASVMYAAVFTLLFFWDRSAFLAGAVAAEYAPWEHVPAPLTDFSRALILLVGLFALVASAQFYRRAVAGTIQRQRGKALLVSFIIRDLNLALIIISVTTAPPGAMTGARLVYLAICPLIEVLFHFVLAFGILRTQLFDIDLKIKLTISRGTVVASFGVVFLFVEQVVQNLASASLGVVAGGVAAALMLLAIQPLRRFGFHVGDVSMPQVQDSPEYVAHRKAQVYEGLLHDMLADGAITPKERTALVRMQRHLGLPDSFASRLEQDVRHELVA